MKTSALKLSLCALLALSSCKKEVDPPCNSTYEGMADPYQRGLQDGQKFIEDETALGKAAGEALTRDDGLKEGQQKLYDLVYAEQHSLGYKSTYQASVDASSNDPASTSAGAAKGASDGLAAGKAKARKNGELQGCHDGKIMGQTAVVHINGDSSQYLTCRGVGYSLGYTTWDGRPIPPGGRTVTRPVTPVLQEACYTKIYNQTVGSSPGKYKQDAFNTAKKSNTEYQAGLQAGQQRDNPENSAIVANATTAGFEAGKAKGISQGTTDGKAIAYKKAYDAKYAEQYLVGLGDSNEVIAGYGAAPTLYNQLYKISYDNGSEEFFSVVQFTGGTGGLRAGYRWGASMRCWGQSVSDQFKCQE